ncbi:hypothetical protein Poly30_30960 [Planctomycetes bacterium Poly30]|uniref:Uncharacterized protein n=1 Tax=Saltatorellus ferox TaxID=2528018 RepID=A0A518EU12_9BACT|nr:hypothetical protein Poly30_30960 [Planctomycetes bacterium Poly30]
MTHDDEEPKARNRRGDRRPGKTRGAEGAARLYLADGLGWLAGYPYGPPSGGADDRVIPWRARPRSNGAWQDLTLDRERLRASFYTLRGAPRKFPRVLESVVGDLAAWSTRVEERLRQLQSAVHEGDPVLAPRSSAAPWPELECLAWDDDDLRERGTLTLQRWAAPLLMLRSSPGEDLSTRFAMEVLATGGNPDRLETARLLLAQPGAFDTRTRSGGAPAALQALVTPRATFSAGRDPSGFDPLDLGPRQAGDSMGTELVRFLLEERDATARDLVLGSLSGLHVQEWAAWWDGVGSLREEAAVLTTLWKDAARSTRALRDLSRLIADRARVLLNEVPRGLEVPSFAASARRVSAQRDADVLRSIQGCLDRLPDSPSDFPAARSLFLDAAGRPLSSLGEGRRAALLDGLAQRLGGPVGRALPNARRLAAAHFVAETALEFEWRSDEVPWEHAEDVLDAAFELASEASSDAWVRRALGDWRFSGAFEGLAIAVRDPRQLAEFARANLHRCTWDSAAVAAYLAHDAAALETEYWQAWAALEERSDSGVRKLRRVCRDPLMLDELRLAFRAGVERADLARFARLWVRKEKADRGQASPPPAPRNASATELEDLCAWIPTGLVPAAQGLLAHADIAALQRALAPTLVDPAALRDELLAIERLLKDEDLSPVKRPSLERRRAMLRARIDGRSTLDPGDFEACRARLESAAIRARFRRWLGELQASTTAALSERARTAIDWSQDRQAELVVAGIEALPGPTRALGYRLLEERAGPRPWDLRDEPANRAWRDEAEARGLRLERWFSAGEFQLGQDVPETTALRFAVEGDPLEIMKMGLWFDTCLSPGNVNFFSTTANAADANKQLLVGRDANGTAQARCLLAITDSWHLMGFHLYAHTKGSVLTASVRGLVLELARSIGIPPAPTGRVRTLVAPAWYDDGPVDLTGQLARLQEGGDLEASLKRSPTTAAFHLTADGLGLDVLEASLEQVLSQPVFSQSPDRTASFAPLLVDRRLPGALAIRLISLLAESHSDLARSLLREFLRRRRLSRLGLGYYQDLELASALRRLGEPGQALRLLRAHENAYDRTWRHEEMARSLEALGRSDQAAEIWRELEEQRQRDA